MYLAEQPIYVTITSVIESISQVQNIQIEMAKKL